MGQKMQVDPREASNHYGYAVTTTSRAKPGPSAATDPREPWIDTAKGIAMVLVVLHHTWLFLGAKGWSVEWWDVADDALTTLRMPLFFVVSGMLAANIVTKTLRELFVGKMALLLYLYLLWSLARSIWFSFVEWPFSAFSPVGNFVLALVWPTNGLWYLYALAVFTFALWSLRKVPSKVVIPAVAMISIAFASTPLTTGNWVFNNFLAYFVFFVAGSRLRQVIVAAVRASTLWHAIGLAAGYIALTAGVAITSGRSDSLARMPLSALAVVAGIALSLQLSRSVVGRPLEKLGQQTLPIYVTHSFIISLVVFIPISSSVPLSVLVFMATAAAAIAAPLAIYRVVLIPGVYTLPWVRPRKRG
ncbi:acyltransferase family protein [Okibacterium fritillariae]|uniref:Uncharacterized membrane protein YcfT n=1 Tax=Okibacterium fritillariae TaxID=123320 RepID=A0A1T5KB05_9MICO|nr:acyltransferase family protein [Okibacterium fritillariae]SKC60856.1 Uncharacterized membrane protein YcfT [Okibacterium fritillariae]